MDHHNFADGLRNMGLARLWHICALYDLEMGPNLGFEVKLEQISERLFARITAPAIHYQEVLEGHKCLRVTGFRLFRSYFLPSIERSRR